MKNPKQLEVMKSVRKYTVFIGRPYGTPKGARGYNRKKENQRKETW